jgi:hypothetical protein
MDQGGGRIDLSAATSFTATIDINSATSSIGFGQLQGNPANAQRTLNVASIAPNTITYAITIAPAVSGLSITTSTSSLTIRSGSNAAFKVITVVDSTTVPGDYYGDIVLTGGTVTLKIPYWVEVLSP